MTPTRFSDLLRVLTQHHVDYIVVRGIAAAAHGSVRATYDLDVVYARGGDNIKKVVAALKPLDPYLRGAPPGLPFSWDTDTVEQGLNFTLTTSLGSIHFSVKSPVEEALRTSAPIRRRCMFSTSIAWS